MFALHSLFAAAVFMVPRTATASVVIYNVSLDTAFLTNPSYSLDFQFINGSVTETVPNNMAIVGSSTAFSDFQLADGHPPFSGEHIVPFAPDGKLTFTISLTTNVDNGPTPDVFAIFVLNQLGNNISTTDPSGADTLISFTESTNPQNPGITVASFDTPNGDFHTSLTPAAVPEPATLVLGALSLLIPVGRLRTERRSA